MTVSTIGIQAGLDKRTAAKINAALSDGKGLDPRAGGKKVPPSAEVKKAASKAKATAKPKAKPGEIKPRDKAQYTTAILKRGCPTCKAKPSAYCTEPRKSEGKASPRAPHAKRVAAVNAK